MRKIWISLDGEDSTLIERVVSYKELQFLMELVDASHKNDPGYGAVMTLYRWKSDPDKLTGQDRITTPGEKERELQRAKEAAETEAQIWAEVAEDREKGLV